MSYLYEMMLCLRPEGSEPEEIDEHSYENLDPDMKIFHTDIDEEIPA